MVYDETLKLDQVRSDLAFYPVPFDKIVAEVCPDARLRRLVRNMIYDGVLSRLLGIDLAEMDKALTRQMKKKAKALALNLAALQAGFAYASEHFADRPVPFAVSRMARDAGPDPDRGQRGRRPRLPDGRCHRRRLVPDHAVVIAVRDADRLPAQVPHGSRDRQGDVRRRPGRGRDRRARHGGRRLVGGRALDDVDIRAWHLADVRVHRTRRTTRRCRQ